MSMAYQTRFNENFYRDSGDSSILQRMEQAYTNNSQANQSYWLEGTKDLRMKSSDQSIWGELYSNLPSFQRKQFNFNRIRRIINMVTGHQRRNRKSTVVMPIEGADEHTADQFSSLMTWVADTTNMYHTLSGAFEGALTTGMNLLSLWMDYRNDPLNGDVRIDNLSYNGFMIDQFFTKQDLSDCNFIWTRKYLSRVQASSLFPARKDEIEGMSGGQKDDKFDFLPENFNIRNPDLLSYDEFWYLDYRKQKVVVDTESGDMIEWTGPKENLDLFIRRFPQLKVKNIDKKTVKLAVVIAGNVMYDGPNPYNIDSYPFVPVLGYFEPDMPYYEYKIQGMVRSLRDAQFLYNRRKVIELDILESQINSGVKVLEDSLVDDNDAFMTGQGRALFIKKDAPQGMDSVQPIPPPGVPSSMIQLSQMLGEEIQQISGVNEELLGSADDDKAGILSMLRQGAGLTTLQKLFDQLDLSQKLIGEKVISLIQGNFMPGKVQRIIAEQPSDQFYNKAFQKFDAVVTEGMLTETQQKMQFVQYMQLQQAGLPIPSELLIEVAPVVQKKELKEAVLKQEQQAAEAQQRQQQLELAQIQANINLTEARATADTGLGIERISRVEENKALAVERRMEAIKDLSQSELNEIKTIKELQGINLDQIQQALSIIEALKARQVGKAEELTPAQSGEMITKSAS
jgi:hypothetical protein